MAEEKALVVAPKEKGLGKKTSQRAVARHIQQAIAQRAPSLVDKAMNALENKLQANDLMAVTIVGKILGFGNDGPSTVINNNINNNNLVNGGGRGRSMSFERIIQTREEEEARLRDARPTSDVQDAEFEDVD